jgi:Uma2 family endonuclease
MHATSARMTYAEYLAAEEATEERHEYINGEVYAMAGGTPRHGALIAAITRHLGNALDGKPCRPYSESTRVRVEATRASFYPDASVVCGELQTSPTDPNAITNPIVLVEVLSDSTEGVDRGAKAAHYRRLASLQEYVLVSQVEPRVEVQRLNAAGNWELFFFGPGDTVELKSVDARFSLDAVYA